MPRKTRGPVDDAFTHQRSEWIVQLERRIRSDKKIRFESAQQILNDVLEGDDDGQRRRRVLQILSSHSEQYPDNTSILFDVLNGATKPAPTPAPAALPLSNVSTPFFSGPPPPQGRWSSKVVQFPSQDPSQHPPSTIWPKLGS